MLEFSVHSFSFRAHVERDQSSFIFDHIDSLEFLLPQWTQFSDTPRRIHSCISTSKLFIYFFTPRDAFSCLLIVYPHSIFFTAGAHNWNWFTFLWSLAMLFLTTQVKIQTKLLHLFHSSVKKQNKTWVTLSVSPLSEVKLGL